MSKCTRPPYEFVSQTYGVPNPDVYSLIVRHNGMVIDAPVGWTIPDCYLPPAIVRDVSVDYTGLDNMLNVTINGNTQHYNVTSGTLAAAPATNNDPDVPTTFIGGHDYYLGTPDAFEIRIINGTTYYTPLYTF